MPNKKAKNTPGPWRVLWRDAESKSILVGPGSENLDDIIQVQGLNRGPNSLLVAAAPDLKKSLENILLISTSGIVLITQRWFKPSVGFGNEGCSRRQLR
jgi:hypothetical protein